MKHILKSLIGLAILFLLGSFLVPGTMKAKPAGNQNVSDTIPAQEPTVTIEEKSTLNLVVVYVTDSAATGEEIGKKFMQIIPVELGGFLKSHNLQMTGPPYAWYKSTPPPFYFDIGVPVNKEPDAVEGRVKFKQLAAGNAVVAHYYGPYERLEKGYRVALAWIKEHHKTPTAAPYEVYVGDPGVEKDPYKVLTNIIFPVK
jgi:effector-binding domain-containing protein